MAITTRDDLEQRLSRVVEDELERKVLLALIDLHAEEVAGQRVCNALTKLNAEVSGNIPLNVRR